MIETMYDDVMNESTIVALATPVGMGALSVIRMSGAKSLQVLSACARLPSALVPRRVYLTDIVSDDGSPVDQVLIVWFQSPASYTGEDVVEISCHGGLLVTRRVFERLLECGAVPAEPGELTRRAFMNGKMDLTQAEAVMDIIAAGSDLALKAAREQLDGAIGYLADSMTDRLLRVTAHVEAYIDFPEEDIDLDSIASLRNSLCEIRNDIERLLATADQGKLLREGIRTVIVGAPNAGKSSLLNTLLGYDRAIVSEIPGTTRDTVEEWVQIGGLALRLVDTAGIRKASDRIELAGIERTERALALADLVLHVVDASQPPLPDQDPLKNQNLLPPRILVLNKADLAQNPAWNTAQGIRFSCTTCQGLEELKQEIVRIFSQRIPALDAAAGIASINARHQNALKRAMAAIRQAESSLECGESPELTAVDLREALEALSELTGRGDTEDILDVVFSSFCLGK